MSASDMPRRIKKSSSSSDVPSEDMKKIKKMSGVREEWKLNESDIICRGELISNDFKRERLRLFGKIEPVLHAGITGHFYTREEAVIDTINNNGGQLPNYFYQLLNKLLIFIIFLDNSVGVLLQPSVNDYNSKTPNFVSSSHSEITGFVNQWVQRIDDPEGSPATSPQPNSVDTFAQSFPDTMNDEELQSMTASIATTVFGDNLLFSSDDDEEKVTVDDVDSLGVSIATTVTLVDDSKPVASSSDSASALKRKPEEVAQLINELVTTSIPDRLLNKEQLLYLIFELHKSLLPKLALRGGKPRNASMSSLVHKKVPKKPLVLLDAKVCYSELMKSISITNMQRIDKLMNITAKQKESFISVFQRDFNSRLTLFISEKTEVNI